jgi:hypothetical protein
MISTTGIKQFRDLSPVSIATRRRALAVEVKATINSSWNIDIMEEPDQKQGGREPALFS